MNSPADVAYPLRSMRLGRFVGDALRQIVWFITLWLISTTASSADDEVLYEKKLDPFPIPIFVPAGIGGRTFLFELDTGAGMDFVDPALKPLLGMHRENQIVDSFGHLSVMEVFDAPAIKIGGWSLPPSEVGVSDMHRFRNHFGLDIRGYIGMNALKNCSLFLDFDHGRMKILKGSSNVSLGMESLDLGSLGGAQALIKCDLGGKPMEFLIDTGANSFLGLRHEAFAALVANGMIETNGGRKIGADTGAGRMVHLIGHFTRGELLGVNLRNVPVDDTNTTNIIGLGFLLNFNSVIDLKNFKFCYRRRKNIPPIYNGRL